MLTVIKTYWPLALAMGVMAIAALIIILKLIRMKKDEKAAYEARLKDQVLNEALKNSQGKRGPFRGQDSARPLEEAARPAQKQALAEEGKIVVKLTVTGKQPANYVVNPEKDVLIGSRQGSSEIVLPEQGIAPRHCGIFSYKGGVYIRNLNDSYETILKRKNKSTRVSDKGIRVFTGDIVQIGVCRIQITLMDYIGNVIPE